MPSGDGPIIIRVDHRERASGIPQLLAAMPRVEITIESLPLGDYLLGTGLVVERKTVADFAQSILDKRLFAQAEALGEAFHKVVYLVEGASLYEGGRLHPNALRGALSYLGVLQGHTLLRTDDPEDSAALIATMSRHAQYGLGYRLSLHPKRKGLSPELQVRYMVEDLPGIGMELAEALLSRFPTLLDLAQADIAELMAVPGIGRKRATAIHALFRHPYSSSQDDADPVSRSDIEEDVP